MCPFGGAKSQFGATQNNQGSEVNFYPNDRAEQGAPQPNALVAEPAMPLEGDAWVNRYSTDEGDHYSQAGDLFRLMNDDQKQQLFNNIAGGLQQASASIQQRMLGFMAKADKAYAQGVSDAMNVV